MEELLKKRMAKSTAEKEKQKQEPKNPQAGTPKKSKWGIVAGLFAVILVALFLLVNYITDFMWFQELGYTSVFLTNLGAKVGIALGVFVVVTGLTYWYLQSLKKNYYKKIASHSPDRSGITGKISGALAAVYGAVVAYMAASNLWMEGLLFANSQSFDKEDPLFGLDISFYIFRLDFITDLTYLLVLALVLLLGLTLVYYLIMMGTRRPRVFAPGEDATSEDPFKEKDAFEGATYNQGNQGKKEGQSPFDQIFGAGKRGPQNSAGTGLDKNNLKELLAIGSRQLMIVGVVLFLMLGVSFFLRQFDLLYAHTGVVYGAGYTDTHVTLWMYRIEILLALVGAGAVVFAFTKKKIKPVLFIPVLMIIVGALGSGAALLVQNYVVSPDEISKETTYLEDNIEYTQYAYGLDNVTVQSFSASSNLTAEDIADNEVTISNIRINDYEPAETFYNQTQSIRQYYTFSDVDVDRYIVNGDYTQVFLSAREIDESKISDTWINQHLKYTHGYGITLSRVDQVTSSGQPEMLIDSIPPVSDVEEIQITQPEIYFGELTNNYVIVGTDEEEFDYPDGDSNQYTSYTGTAGIELNLFNRVLFSIREQSIKLLVSSNINSDSKIIINRNIVDRVETLMPYLSYDDDPYLCVVDGKLYWIIDAYTSSSRFPYSEPYDSDSSVNYIRNSVKVVVDAYNGDTTFYIVDEEDPIVMTLASIYPSLFSTLEDMPEALQEHIRYPQTMFTIQANVYKRYHMSDVKVFYQNEDQWDIANETYGTDEQEMTPNYYIMSIPGETTEEFVMTIPYTPKDKQNMTGLLLARCDGEHYGELILYQMPKSKVVYGPMQIEALIDQNTEISKEFSLWNSSGSSYTRGNLFVIPIEDSLIYVEPIYLEATNSSIPEVKRVIVVYGDKIAYESTLAEALEVLFGDGATSSSSSSSSSSTSGTYTQAELIQLVQEAYDNALEALSNSEWAAYGEYIDLMGEYLELLGD